MLGICIKNESTHKLWEATNELLQQKWYNMTFYLKRQICIFTAEYFT